MIFLREGTQTKIRVGPLRDYLDGVTMETTVTLGAADEASLMKAGGGAATDISGNTWAAVTGADGFYDLTLTTGNLDTIGDLTISVADDDVFVPLVSPIRCHVVAAEIYDMLFADGPGTITLPGQAAPSATPTLPELLGWLYKTLRNKKTQTSSQWSLYDDAGSTVDAKATVSDDGSTATKGEIGTGP